MPDHIQNGMEHRLSSDELEDLRTRAFGAVIKAYEDPSSLTPQEHIDVQAIHSLTLRAMTEANAILATKKADTLFA